MDGTDLAMWVSHDIEQLAKHKARARITRERWNRDVTVFTFSILIIVLILLYSEVAMPIVAIVAILGLVLVWFLGWLEGRKLYTQIYDEERLRLTQEVKSMEREMDNELIEEKIRKAMRDMWR